MKIGVSLICGLGENEDCDSEAIQEEIIDMIINGIKDGGCQLDKIKTVEACISYAE